MDDLIGLAIRLLKNAAGDTGIQEQAIFVAWRASMGDNINRVTVPIGLLNRTLVVAVTDSTWEKQLKTLSSQAITKINSIFGEPLLKSIRYVIDQKAVVRTSNSNTNEIIFKRTGDFDESLEKDASVIQDLELRRLFIRTASKCLERTSR